MNHSMVKLGDTRKKLIIHILERALFEVGDQCGCTWNYFFGWNAEFRLICSKTGLKLHPPEVFIKEKSLEGLRFIRNYSKEKE